MSGRQQFETLAQGRFSKDSVKCIFENHERDLPKDSYGIIGLAWDAFQRSHRAAFDDDLFDVLDFSVRQKLIRIKLGATSYRTFVGTRSTQFVRSFGTKGIPNPFAVRVLTRTADEKMVFGLRSEWVQTYAHRLDAPAGFVDRGRDWSDRSPDPFKAAKREVEEELQVASDDISDPVCVGVLFDADFDQTVMIFQCHLDSEAALLKTKTSEFEEIRFVNSSSDSVLRFLRTEKRLISPQCAESLALWLRRDRVSPSS